MRIFAIDDEPDILAQLHEAIAQAEPAAEIVDFSTADRVLEAVRDPNQRPDVVFSDIRLPGMDGLSLAVRIKEIAPKTKIIFTTAYSQYAMEAFKRHVNGYILKPVEPEEIRSELDALDLPADPPTASEKLQVQCFGHFEVFWRGKPLIFSRSKIKELLAYLIDREGAYCSAGDIINALWKDEDEPKDAKHYLRVLTSELFKTLKEIGMSGVLLRRRGQWAVDCDLLNCDYYRMKAGDVSAVNAYQGEYMIDYSWAELTTARMYFNSEKPLEQSIM